MRRILSAQTSFEWHFPVVIVGGGGAGLCAALAASDAGAAALVVERDSSLTGSTAMSTGLIPAAGTPEQLAAGTVDTPALFLADILAKTKGKTSADLALMLAEHSASTVAWLRDLHAVPLSLAEGWLYPGHSVGRMYGTPNKSGAELMAALEAAVAQTGATILADATVSELHVDGDRICGIRAVRPGGEILDVGCDALVLACSGFGGNAEMVRRYIPAMAGAIYHGHPGNKGDALDWGVQLGAAVADVGAYQGHGGLAVGHAVPILWPLIMEGGFQVNREGLRFSNEAAGYSEQAEKINQQPGRVAWSIFDERLHILMTGFDDYRDALQARAIVQADSAEELAQVIGADPDVIGATLAEVQAMTEGALSDPFGRDFTGKPPLRPPYRCVKVTGALFHTQGGLMVDRTARVVKARGGVFPNLFAAGGAARGISGPGADGYLAGNGLLCATTLGRIAGENAARLVMARHDDPPTKK